MEPSSNKPRAAYTSDVSDAEWDFCRPYLMLMKEDAPQRDYPLRELFNALRYIVRCGCQWRMTVTLNDKLIIDDAQLPGIPRQGPLALQLHPERKDGEWGASLVQFRNIRIRQLGAGE